MHRNIRISTRNDSKRAADILPPPRTHNRHVGVRHRWCGPVNGSCSKPFNQAIRGRRVSGAMLGSPLNACPNQDNVHGMEGTQKFLVCLLAILDFANYLTSGEFKSLYLLMVIHVPTTCNFKFFFWYFTFASSQILCCIYIFLIVFLLLLLAFWIIKIMV